MSFDDEAIRDAARRDPVGFVEGLPRRTILDEVQRVPELFTALKATIDARRTAGRFILTGSANVLLVPRLADSLAGRSHGHSAIAPLAQCELQGKRPRLIETLFRGGFRTRLADRLGTTLVDRIVGGGYPAALARRAAARRRAWYRDLVETQIQRDVRDVARIHSIRTLRILIVEDNPDARDMMTYALTEKGHDVEAAVDGPTAFRAVEEWCPDVALLDIGLPGMSGHEVARRLKDNPRLRDTTLVALTGWGQEKDRLLSADSGIHHHLTKPIDPDQLERVLAKVVKR